MEMGEGKDPVADAWSHRMKKNKWYKKKHYVLGLPILFTEARLRHVPENFGVCISLCLNPVSETSQNVLEEECVQ